MIKSISLLILILPFITNLIFLLLMMNPLKNKFHPISLMIILILLTLLISIYMNYMFYSLMSFIIFLALIGGLMIIFMYITSLTNNEFFFINFKNLLINLFKISPLIMMLIYYSYLNLTMNYSMNLNIQDSWKINNHNNIFDLININMLYNEINNKSSMFIMLYIYYSMICIMNICYKLKAPLRQLMY